MATLEADAMQKITLYMTRLKENYDRIRGLPKNEIDDFWDVVVVTTADEAQREAYRRQVELKIELKQIPHDVPYLLIADPPGAKIGSGGSMLHALKELHARYGSELYYMRVLLICAGGRSQRLPTATVLGKLFLPLPFAGQKPYHMLDYKLAAYMPFLKRVTAAGVLLTCSDDVETFYLPPDLSEREFVSSGFVALGHISSIEIGRSHGVYVLPPSTVRDDLVLSRCRKVLQKPTVSEMEKWNAILEDGKSVCTDSVYFFGRSVCEKLVDFATVMGEVTCEIDAYGDFLRPLGEDSDRNYVTSTDTVVEATPSLAQTRNELYDLLRNSPFLVMAVRHSSFYHLGTMREYVTNLSSSSRFFAELSCSTFAHSRCVDDEASGTRWKRSERDFVESNPGVTVMHSVVSPDVCVGPSSVLEFCDVRGSVTVGHHCILSNCLVAGGDLPVVPSNCCFHTVAVFVDGVEKYATVAFGIDDDLKKSAKAEEKLPYMGVALTQAASCTGSSELFDDECTSRSLWNARLFPVCETMEGSFRETLAAVCSLKSSDAEGHAAAVATSKKFVSMEDVLRCRNVAGMLSYQEKLQALIRS